MNRISWLLMFFILILSCTGVPVPDSGNEDLESLSLNKINAAIDDRDYATALQDISKLKRDGIIADDSYDKKAQMLMNDLFQTAVSEGNYEKASSIFRSAEEASITLDTDEDYYSLITDEIGEKSDKSDSWKTYIARNNFNINELSDQKISELLDLAEKSGDRKYLEVLIDEADLRSIPVDERLRNLTVHASNTDLIKGTVTIYVNRGMRIQNGVGLPDTVIGSGFFIDKQGYLLTNYHVIESEVDPEYEGFSRLYIKLSNDPNKKIPAKVIGWDKAFDIALLKVEITPEVIFSFSGKENYTPGDPIMAIGSPGGLENTLTSGIVSADGRKFLQMATVLQVDVPINHGNSGGPLIDADGDLAGVVFAGIEQFEGINFAIPGEYLIPLIPSLYKGGAVEHPFAGISLLETENNLEVIYTMPGSPANRAGIKPGDIIKSISDIELHDIDQINRIFLHLKPESVVKVVWESEGKEISGLIALGKRPEIPLLEAARIDIKDHLIPAAFGMKIKNISQGLFESKYIVTDVFSGSIADETGLSENDPFTIKKWQVLEDQGVLIMQIRIKKRKAGFLESGVQLGTYLETSNFI